MVTVMHTAAFVCLLLIAISSQRVLSFNDEFDAVIETTTTDVPETSTESSVYYISHLEEYHQEERSNRQNFSLIATNNTNNATIYPEARIKLKNQRRKNTAISEAIKLASIQGFNAMIDLYDRKEPEILRKGQTRDNTIKKLENA